MLTRDWPAYHIERARRPARRESCATGRRAASHAQPAGSAKRSRLRQSKDTNRPRDRAWVVAESANSEPVCRDRVGSKRRHFHRWAAPHDGRLTPSRAAGAPGTASASETMPVASAPADTRRPGYRSLCEADAESMREVQSAGIDFQANVIWRSELGAPRIAAGSAERSRDAPVREPEDKFFFARSSQRDCAASHISTARRRRIAPSPKQALALHTRHDFSGTN